MCFLGKCCFCALLSFAQCQDFLCTIWNVVILIFFEQRSWLANSHQLSFSLNRRLSASLSSTKNRCDHLVPLQCNNKRFNRCVTIALIFQKNSLEDGILLFYQPDIHICCERIVLVLGNMFKFLGHTQLLEVCTTSKENILFHDNGFVVFRFAYGFLKFILGLNSIL
jgi:hypothetical protein